MISLLLINCRSDKTHKISTITIERIEQNLPKQIDYHWHLVADPPPTHDLVVIIGSEHQPDNWIDYDRKNWTSDVKHRSVPPYYVVIKKSNVPYRVGKACGIDKDGNVITE